MNSLVLSNVTHDALKHEMEKIFKFKYGDFERTINFLLKNKDFLNKGEFVEMKSDNSTVSIDTVGLVVADHEFSVSINKDTFKKLADELKVDML